MIICVCNRISESQLRMVMLNGKPLDYPGVLAELGTDVICGACRDDIERMLVENSEKG